MVKNNTCTKEEFLELFKKFVVYSLIVFGLMLTVGTIKADALVCEYQHNALINEKTRIICETDYNEEMSCILSISEQNGVYDVQPKIEFSLVIGVVDSFFADNGVVNMIINPNNLIAESNYTLLFDCVSYPIGSNHEQYTDTITYNIDRGRILFGYTIWIKDNAPVFIGGIFVLAIIVFGLILLGLRDVVSNLVLKYVYWGMIILIIVMVVAFIFKFMKVGVL